MTKKVEQMIEVKWVARGGQGAVTASNILAHAGYSTGFHGIQAIPFYGAERRGATVKAFTRLHNTAIRSRSQIYEPNVLIICDPKLAKQLSNRPGVRSAKYIILNSSANPSDIVLDRKINIGIVDATSIAENLGLKVAGIPVYNTIMLGAFSKTTNFVSLEAITNAIDNYFSPKIAKLNIKAAEIAYDQTVTGLSQASADFSISNKDIIPQEINHLTELPVTPVSLPTKVAMGIKTGAWRDFRPILNVDSCNNCLQCWLYCPDGAITVGATKFPVFDYDYCKGCGICANECRPKAITMDKEVVE